MLYPISNAGQFGVISDREAFELPLNTWTNAKNVRFANGYAEKMLGELSVGGAASIEPYFAISSSSPTTNYWVYAGLEKVYVWDGGAHTNITRQVASVDDDYDAGSGGKWTGATLAGLVLLNNGVDEPQLWTADSISTKCVDLPNWPANTRCSSLRVFKQFLIALDITKGADRYPYMVKWSDPAEPGTVPASWDEADPTTLAGESPALSETAGFAVDGLALRDTFIIYKEDSVWGMQLLNTGEVFRIFKIFTTGGIMAKNCAVEFFNGKHAVFGISDVYQHDGQQMKSIVSEKVRKRLYGSIEGSAFNVCHVVHNLNQREVWFCYPTTGNTLCNEAMVWNYETDTIAFRELPNVSHIGLGIITLDVDTDSWDSDLDSWDSDATSWGDRLYNPTQFNLLFCAPESSQLFMGNYTNARDNVGFSASIERRGLALPVRSSQPPDVSQRKFVMNVWPRITGTEGKIVFVEVGSQENNFSSVEWGTPQAFVIGETVRIDCRVSGRLFAIRFSSTDIMTWQLHGYEIEYTPTGRY